MMNESTMILLFTSLIIQSLILLLLYSILSEQRKVTQKLEEITEILRKVE